MNKLRIPLSAVAGREGFSVEERVPEEDLRPKGSPRSSLNEVAISGTITPMSSEYLFTGTLSGVFERPCDRCLEPAQKRVELEVSWLFESGVENHSIKDVVEYTEEDAIEEDVEGYRVRFFEGGDLDLAPHVWEEMVLADPSKFYCSEDCKGLCPHCGMNLNQGACSCASGQETSGSGLAALKEMFPDLRSESLEE